MDKTIGKFAVNVAPLILVVDDDESMREALQSLLRSVGYDTSLFASAEDFLTGDNRHSADCLILDVRMPEMNGLALQNRLIAEKSRLPIVFISAHGEAGEKEQALAAGAIDFLQKPFSESSLLDAVSMALKSKLD
ncbi:MAG TPA: response regulator [Pyrinomonadaceae bacterium]|nr:response regulator [Pyrinomonadaceae bacterium]